MLQYVLDKLLYGVPCRYCPCVQVGFRLVVVGRVEHLESAESHKETHQYTANGT